MKPKQVWIRQMDAARQAQISVVVEILGELDYLKPEAAELDPSLVAECLIRNVDFDGVIRDLDEAHEVEQLNRVSDGASQDHRANGPSVGPVTPTCPRCGDEMVIRTVKNGPRAGSQFYGCVDYPACKGTLPVEA